MMDFTGWTTKDVVTSIVATGAISALLTNVFGWVRDMLVVTSRNNRLASYLAMRLSSLLEAYTIECTEFVTHNDNAPHLPDEQYPEWISTLPTLPDYPDDADGWRAMNRGLADRCLRLRNNISGYQTAVSQTADFDTDGLDVALKRFGSELGREAWILARDLRHAHGLAQVEMAWDPYAFLLAAHFEVVKEDEKRAADNRAMFERMEALIPVDQAP